jgi:transposase
MGKSKAPYPAEFRAQVVELHRNGKTASALSRQFGCSGQTIANWVAQAAVDAGRPLPGREGLTTVEREELARLRRENRQLKMERDILEKATVWFAARKGGLSTPSTNS